MKILFISNLCPNPDADHASAFLTYKTMKYLARRHEISVVAFIRTEQDRDSARQLKEFCRHVELIDIPRHFFRSVWARAKMLALMPLAVSQIYSRELQEKVQELIKREKFDVIQVEYIPMGQYISGINNTATVLNAADLISLTAQRFVEYLPWSRKKIEWGLEKFIASRYEARLCARFDHVLAISPLVKERLLAANPKINISLIPAGVDISGEPKAYNPAPGKTLMFMGALWRQENIDAVLYFYREIFGRIRQRAPEVTWYIVGGAPAPEIMALANDPQVVVTGFVPDLTPYYQQSDVSIAPVRIAGGVMCKVLDAMAAGLPVVTTSAGNSGIGARQVEEIMVADNPEDFAAGVLELLQNPDRREAMGRRGLEFVRQNYSWEQIIEKIERIYEQCVASHESR